MPSHPVPEGSLSKRSKKAVDNPSRHAALIEPLVKSIRLDWPLSNGRAGQSFGRRLCSGRTDWGQMIKDGEQHCALRALSSGDSRGTCLALPCVCYVEEQLLSDGEREELADRRWAAYRLARRTASIEAIFAVADAQRP